MADETQRKQITEIDDEFGGLDGQFDALTNEFEQDSGNAESEVVEGQEQPVTRGNEKVASMLVEAVVEPNSGLPSSVIEESGDKAVDQEPVIEKKVSKGGRPKILKNARQKRLRIIRNMLNRSGRTEIPEISELMKGKRGQMVAIRDIAIFIGKPEDQVLADIASECPLVNRVNLSAEVQLARVIAVGVQLLKANRMYQPVQIVKIDENGALECTSGRHRLVALALIYGGKTKIPVNIESMTINEARDAVVVANESRPIKAMERAEHAILKAVAGNAAAAQDDLYLKTVMNRATSAKYCVYSVLQRQYPDKLSFKVSATSSRRDGGLTTLSNVEKFWMCASPWTEGMERKQFDVFMKASVEFLNQLTSALKAKKGFDPKHHLASMTMAAAGKYYRSYSEITGKDAVEIVDKIATKIVDMGEVGRQKSEKTYEQLSKALMSVKDKSQ